MEPSSIREIAHAQGVGAEFEALQKLRRGAGVQDHWALRVIPASWKRRVLGVSSDTDQELRAGLEAFRALVEQAPPDERELLEMAFNLNGLYPGDWMDRTEDYAASLSHSRSSRRIRGDVDRAIIQLVRRTQEAAEANPIPPGSTGLDARSHQPTAAEFFQQDYVRNSRAFAAAWAQADSVDMCGFGHNRMVVSYSAEIMDLLLRKGRIRVLLQDPEGDSVLHANARSSTPKASPNSVRHQHRAGLATLRAIRDSAGESGVLRVRAYDILPPFTAYFFDADDANGQAFIWFWSWRQPSAWRPGFRILRSIDVVWFHRFRDQFESLWTDEEATREINLDHE